jgi:hypothetical protein
MTPPQNVDGPGATPIAAKFDKLILNVFMARVRLIISKYMEFPHKWTWPLRVKDEVHSWWHSGRWV